MEIKAFKAWRFNSKVVGDTASCIAPPYDVISDRQQANLYKHNEFNIVRIDKGKTHKSDNEKSNVYTRAAKYLKNYIKSGALKQDPTERLYAYVQDFDTNVGKFQRSGFIALGKLQEFGTGVRPHEKTLDGPKADRLKLTLATATQFGQIFMLYDDKAKVADKIIAKAAKKRALLDARDDDGVRHRLYAIDDPKDIAAISRTMKKKSTVIADGHHRYETALNYFHMTGNPQAQYQMMTFVNMRNEGLVILPTHRLVHDLKGFDPDKLIKKLGADFSISVYPYKTAEKQAAKRQMFTQMLGAFKKGQVAFGIYANDGNFYVATFENTKRMDSLASKMSKAWRSLDVSVLHKVVLEHILGIGDKALASESNIEYIKDVGNAIDDSIKAVDTGKAQVVFFMNPTKIEQVQAVAAEGEKMPQKSTFFYPKIFTGLTINVLETPKAENKK
jgi:uncharacterized protein (DUF1015 family)